MTEATGHMEIDDPRDRDGSFDPQIVKKRQRRLTGVDEIVLSLNAKGLTTGKIGASVSMETITDKVIEETNDWANRPFMKFCLSVTGLRPDGVRTLSL